MTPFKPEKLTARAARYEKARQDFIDRANDAETAEDKAYYFQQSAMAGAMLAVLEQVAADIGIAIAPFC